MAEARSGGSREQHWDAVRMLAPRPSVCGIRVIAGHPPVKKLTESCKEKQDREKRSSIGTLAAHLALACVLGRTIVPTSMQSRAVTRSLCLCTAERSELRRALTVVHHHAYSRTCICIRWIRPIFQLIYLKINGIPQLFGTPNLVIPVFGITKNRSLRQK